MNIVRKLRGGGANVSSNTSPDLSDGSPSSPHTQLGLMHLKKLFLEYTHPPHPLTDNERDDKLYNMLPLFCKVGIHFSVNVFLIQHTLIHFVYHNLKFIHDKWQ